MNNSILIIGTLTVILLFFVKDTYKRVYQKSSLNQKNYLVRLHDNPKLQIQSANLLASLTNKKDKLCNFLEKRHKNNKAVQRLLHNKNVKIEELAYEYSNEAAYSINKGERIGICIRKNNKVQNENTMFFVLMHELAHIMSVKYAHDEEFWNNFAFLIKAATQCGVYKYENFDANPTNYCGHRISFTPK